MNRLTKNVLTETSPMYELGEWADNEEAIDKLGQLEDIEKELGVDLITLFKALKQRYVYSIRAKRNEEGRLIEPLQLEIYKQENISLGYSNGYVKDTYGIVFWNEYYTAMIDTKDYGKTWALTKEELEESK